METQYTTGKDFLAHVDGLNQYLDKRANPFLLGIIHAEVSAYGDALRFELHQKLEKTMKATETERMQSMTELELRIKNSIAENTRKDTIRERWLKGVVVITLVNLTALGILIAKLKGVF